MFEYIRHTLIYWQVKGDNMKWYCSIAFCRNCKTYICLFLQISFQICPFGGWQRGSDGWWSDATSHLPATPLPISTKPCITLHLQIPGNAKENLVLLFFFLSAFVRPISSRSTPTGKWVLENRGGALTTHHACKAHMSQQAEKARWDVLTIILIKIDARNFRNINCIQMI